VSNRRITTRPVEIGGRKIAAGERLSLIWISANRDARVFEEPDAYRPDRDPTANLLYGAGIHVCPGAPSGSDGDARGDGGNTRVHDPDRPDPGQAAHRRRVPWQWFRYPASASPIGAANKLTMGYVVTGDTTQTQPTGLELIVVKASVACAAFLLMRRRFLPVV